MTTDDTSGHEDMGHAGENVQGRCPVQLSRRRLLGLGATAGIGAIAASSGFGGVAEAATFPDGATDGRRAASVRFAAGFSTFAVLR